MSNAWSDIPAPDHNHTDLPPGAWIPEVGAGRGGNGIDVVCPICDRQDPEVQWKHSIDCPNYLPHPSSRAAATIPVGGRLSNMDRLDHGPLRWIDVPAAE